MAAPSKQRRVARRDKQSSDAEENAEDSGNEGDMEIIDVEFDVKMPVLGDQHGVKNLLQQLFLKAHVNVSELADILIEQNSITSVIKEADVDNMELDDDMEVNFGVFSVLNLTEKKNVDCVRSIRSYLLSHCKEVCEGSQYEMFQNILNDTRKHVGLIISERFVNIPAKIAVPLYAELSCDMDKAKRKMEPFDFEYYILICKTIVFDEGTANENILYANPEEEIIAEVATMSFNFSVSGEQDSGLGGKWTDEDDEGHPKRKVLVIPASKYDIMCNKLEAELATQ